MHARPWPQRPVFETDALAARLDAMNAGATARAFTHALAQTGVARIDIGDLGRTLCDQAVVDTDPYFKDPSVGRVQDGWLRSRAVRRLATFPMVIELLELTYGRPPFAFQTLNFQRGTQQETHADTIHFHCVPNGFMCGVWIALEDIGPDSGPLTYRPGSHRLPILTMRGAGVNHDRPNHEDYARTYVPALGARLDAAGLASTTAVLNKGEALVWAANLAHGGAPVTNAASTRRSLVVHFYFKDCLYYTPMTSDESVGRYRLRLPINIATGGVEWPRRAGALALPGWKQIADAARKLLLRRPVVVRVRTCRSAPSR